MVEGHTVEEDGLTWTLKLRDGLRFHDKEPVLARDVVASIRRFAPRVIFANALMDAADEVSGESAVGIALHVDVYEVPAGRKVV
jgi:peptide/nickel transport system substrate-binding protein